MLRYCACRGGFWLSLRIHGYCKHTQILLKESWFSFSSALFRTLPKLVEHFSENEAKLHTAQGRISILLEHPYKSGAAARGSGGGGKSGNGAEGEEEI